MIADRLGLVGQVIGVHPDAMPTDDAGPELQDIHFVRAAFSTASVSISILLKMIDKLFTSAMFRSRCVFSITFAASAMRMLSAL